MKAALDINVRTNLQPGDLGKVVEMHGILYAREYRLNLTFEGHVAAGLGEFAKGYDERKDRLWLAEVNERLVGSIAINGLENQIGQLRWFLVDSEVRGQGLGQRLLSEALDFCRDRGFKSVLLWTISELQAARDLYQKAGFKLTEAKTHQIWGDIRTEQRYDLFL